MSDLVTPYDTSKQLTREDFLQTRDSEGTSVHDSMAFTLCNQIISSPDSGFTKSLIKLLNNLTLTQVCNTFIFLPSVLIQSISVKVTAL